MKLEIGSLFSERYRLNELSAEGGTASVYSAYDTSLKKIVALKIFSKKNISSSIISEVWDRESKSLGKLNHPHIVNFITSGRDEHTTLRYIVLEWLEGDTLEKVLIEKGGISWEQFYELYGSPILSALCAAFEKNVIHRDLSTKNILIQESGVLKIIDFGQSKLDDNIVGVTVGDWKTPPYCTPEDDTGRYTSTRDSYSFAAIAVRALCGHVLENHDDLYDALGKIKFPKPVDMIIRKSLDRNPENRPKNIVEFDEKLQLKEAAENEDVIISLPVRFSPGVSESLGDTNNPDFTSAIDEIVSELNDVISVEKTADDQEKSDTRFVIETSSSRIIVDVDSNSPDHLVIIGHVSKYFHLDRLYSERRWLPNVRFSARLPSTIKEKDDANKNIINFFKAFEKFLHESTKSTYLSNHDIFDEWNRLLDAMRFIARTQDEPLRYENAVFEGLRLIVELENPHDANEGQVRTITNNGRWVFSGVVEDVLGNVCTLYSNWPTIRVDSIPLKGSLEMDWRQTRISLERQGSALEKFANNNIPNQRLRSLITLSDKGAIEPQYKSLSVFFDKKLDDDKKLIVSRYLATPDLFLIHGPPGTGKTKLITEIIQQQIGLHSNSKILLVSQTHVAVDNALELIISYREDLNIVRIGSGTKEIADSVESCSVESQGRKLQKNVEKSAKKYLKKYASELGVDFKEVEIGRKAIEVLRLREAIKSIEETLEMHNDEIRELNIELENIKKETKITQNETYLRTRAGELESKTSELKSEYDLLDNKLGVATERLVKFNDHGADLSKLDVTELSEWCDLLLDGKDRNKLRTLFELAEEWELKFGKSQDFKVAIIASASIVSGTCIGFCSEAAALSTEYDLCIVDEASKATTTELLVPMSKARKVVLVGDHHQLPAVIDYALKSKKIKDDYMLSDDQLERQLFEALQVDLSDGHKAGLSIQYRMRSVIGNLISECFYEGAISNGESVDQRDVPNLELSGISSSVTWIDTDPDDIGCARQRVANKTSFINEVEVNCILALLKRILFVLKQDNKYIFDYTIAVISGYGSQAMLLDREIKKDTELDKLNIVCDTVHAFQGREVDICIYSITRNNKEGDVGFLKDWRHLNVALSRAKNFLVLVGGMSFCRTVPEPNPFKKLVDYVDNTEECEIREWKDD